VAVSGIRNAELGAFLRTRRARVSPEDVGLPATERRRVPGLRREELAQLAGVSLDYYARLEQGRQPTASQAVLDAVARVLRMTPDERSHLYVLARLGDRRADADPGTRTLGRRVRRLLDLMGDTPAILCGRYVEIVAANDAACFLFANFSAMPARERNTLQWMLTSPLARDLYADQWEDVAGEMIGTLRLDAARYPAGPRIAELVDELMDRSPFFHRLWTEHTVSACTHGRKVLHHRHAGPLEFFNEAVTVHSAPDQTLLVFIPGDPDLFAAALWEFRTRPGSATDRA